METRCVQIVGFILPGRCGTDWTTRCKARSENGIRLLLGVNPGLQLLR